MITGMSTACFSRHLHEQTIALMAQMTPPRRKCFLLLSELKDFIWS